MAWGALLAKCGLRACGRHLALRVESVGRWESTELGACAKDLKGPERGGQQSVWAHIGFGRFSHLPPYTRTIQHVSKRGTVPSTLSIHALSQFVFLARSGTMKSKLDMLSFPYRPSVGQLRKTRGQHLVPSLECCHRDLVVQTPSTVEESIKNTGHTGAKYTRDQLRILFEGLKDQGVLCPDLLPYAEKAFRQRP